MDKYDELIKRLRRCEQFRCRECEYEQVMGCRAKLNEEAADAIEAQDRHILTLQHEMMAEAESHTAIVERLSKQNKKLEEALKTALDFIPCWIPVTERLPEEMDRSCGGWSEAIRPSVDVLVWLSHEERQSVAWYSYTFNEWTTVDENTMYYSEEVTHWMPLPEPLKEETE